VPLTAKGEKIKQALVKEYGEKKGTSVLYAGKNSGRFTGIDSAKLDSILEKCDAFDTRIMRWDQGNLEHSCQKHLVDHKHQVSKTYG